MPRSSSRLRAPGYDRDLATRELSINDPKLGKLIERADKTSRILDLRYKTLPEKGVPQTVSETDALEWSAILRSCSAWDAYKTIHGAEVSPRLVAEFLLLNEDFPRSVHFCVGELNNSLRKISGVAEGKFSNDAEKLAGRLVAELQFSTIDEIFDAGLHDYLDVLQGKLNDIGAALEDLLATQPAPMRILICGSLYVAGEVLARNG